jgi:hypothetical protein
VSDLYLSPAFDPPATSPDDGSESLADKSVPADNFSKGLIEIITLYPGLDFWGVMPHARKRFGPFISKSKVINSLNGLARRNLLTKIDVDFRAGKSREHKQERTLFFPENMNINVYPGNGTVVKTHY